MPKSLLLPLVITLLASCANHPSGPPPDGKSLRPERAHQGHWTTFDGTVLPFSCWPQHPPRRPRAVVILAQGWDSVGSDYDTLGQGLAAAGYVVYASENRCGIFDPVKHRRGTAPRRWHDWVDDFEAFDHFVRHRHPGVPVFYQGHSMGVTVCLQAVAEDKAKQPRGLIVHSAPMPLMDTSDRRLLGAVFDCFGWLRLPHLRIDPAEVHLTGDPALNSEWAWSDNRVRAGYSLGFIIAAARLGHEARVSSRSLTLPVLALGGAKDNVVTSSKADVRAHEAYLHQELAGGRAQVVFFKDGCHTLTEAPTQRQAIAAMVGWLNAQTRFSRK